MADEAPPKAWRIARLVPGDANDALTVAAVRWLNSTDGPGRRACEKVWELLEQEVCKAMQRHAEQDGRSEPDAVRPDPR